MMWRRCLGLPWSSLSKEPMEEHGTWTPPRVCIRRPGWKEVNVDHASLKSERGRSSFCGHEGSDRADFDQTRRRRNVARVHVRSYRNVGNPHVTSRESAPLRYLQQAPNHRFPRRHFHPLTPANRNLFVRFGNKKIRGGTADKKVSSANKKVSLPNKKVSPESKRLR